VLLAWLLVDKLIIACFAFCLVDFCFCLQAINSMRSFLQMIGSSSAQCSDRLVWNYSLLRRGASESLIEFTFRFHPQQNISAREIDLKGSIIE